MLAVKNFFLPERAKAPETPQLPLIATFKLINSICVKVHDGKGRRWSVDYTNRQRCQLEWRKGVLFARP